jgi:hypothetical protein
MDNYGRFTLVNSQIVNCLDIPGEGWALGAVGQY